MAIDRKALFSITYYEYGEPYFGSDRGWRYRLAREPLANVHFVPPDKREPAKLLATVWRGTESWAAADKNSMESEAFDFSPEGLDAAWTWLSKKCEETVS